MFGNVSAPKEVNQSFGNKTPKKLYTNPKTNQLSSKAEAFQAFNDFKSESYNKVYSHELAHQQAGGSQAGSINIKYDSNGIAIGGHVSIQVPNSVNKALPEQTLKEAEIAYNAATAPGDLSAADNAIASMAQSIMGEAMQAQNSKNNKESKGQRLNVMG